MGQGFGLGRVRLEAGERFFCQRAVVRWHGCAGRGGGWGPQRCPTAVGMWHLGGTVSGCSGVGWGWVWGSWRSFPTIMTLWFGLGPRSVGAVGWVGVGFGISSAFPNLNESVVLFRAMVSGHSGMGWG